MKRRATARPADDAPLLSAGTKQRKQEVACAGSALVENQQQPENRRVFYKSANRRRAVESRGAQPRPFMYNQRHRAVEASRRDGARLSRLRSSRFLVGFIPTALVRWRSAHHALPKHLQSCGGAERSSGLHLHSLTVALYHPHSYRTETEAYTLNALGGAASPRSFPFYIRSKFEYKYCTFVLYLVSGK